MKSFNKAAKKLTIYTWIKFTKYLKWMSKKYLNSEMDIKKYLKWAKNISKKIVKLAK